jgi:carbon monoxide dehydrogenase subunit G
VAIRHVLIERPPAAVWAVLCDGERYAEWVVGTQRIRSADGDWPAVGSTIHFDFGIGPITFSDRVVVRVCEPPRRLELEAHAGALGTARIAIEVMAWGADTLVVVDEHPLRGIGGALHSVPNDVLIHLRNRRMLRNLSRIVEDESTRAEAAPTVAVTPASP